jgi:peptide deformylase
MEPTALINPRIIAHTDDRLKDWEGCLSVAGTRGLVPRFSMVEVEYVDRWGILQQQVFTDFIARIVQHECDHLEGRVFVDRVENTQELITEVEYQQQLQAISIAEQGR